MSKRIYCIIPLLLGFVPVATVFAEGFPDDPCGVRTSEIYPIHSVAGTPQKGGRVKIEILFERPQESARARSEILLASDAAVCRSPNPLLKPQERGWIELGVGPRLSDLRPVKNLVGFKGFRVTVLPGEAQLAD